MRRINIYLLLTGLLMCLFSCKNNPSHISLAGEWEFALDSTDTGINENWAGQNFKNTILLPGTTDDAGYGTPNKLAPAIQKPQVLHLTRKNSYVGPAWYSKEVNIPSGWKEKAIELKLERVIWQTSVWVDGKQVEGMQESLVAPHLYDLTEHLTPGKHKITIRVDNRKRYDITAGDMAHAYTNQTQIMWNGIIGEIALTAKDAVSIRNLQAYPDYKNKQVKVKCLVNNTGVATSGSLNADIRTATDPVIQVQQHVTLQPGENRLELIHAYLVHPSGIYPDRPLQRYPRNQIRLPGFGKERAGSIIERSEDFPQRYIGVLHIPAYRIPSDGTRRLGKGLHDCPRMGTEPSPFPFLVPAKSSIRGGRLAGLLPASRTSALVHQFM